MCVRDWVIHTRGFQLGCQLHLILFWGAQENMGVACSRAFYSQRLSKFAKIGYGINKYRDSDKVVELRLLEINIENLTAHRIILPIIPVALGSQKRLWTVICQAAGAGRRYWSNFGNCCMRSRLVLPTIEHPSDLAPSFLHISVVCVALISSSSIACN